MFDGRVQLFVRVFRVFVRVNFVSDIIILFKFCSAMLQNAVII